MNKRDHRILRRDKRNLETRLERKQYADQAKPMFRGGRIAFEMADRVRAIGYGGIGAVHTLVRRLRLDRGINESVELLKFHVPYHESDHVLNIAYNVLAGGTALEDIERLRNDETYTDGLGAERIPDPTTAGDFLRRFDARDIVALQETFNETRRNLWLRQSPSFREEAVLDVDGTIAGTQGECKEGMDISYKSEWGYLAQVVSLANTGEPLFVVNRSGNRPSHEGAAAYFHQAARLCRRAGFKRILFRGDTDFTQTGELDGWEKEGVQFIFGIDAMPNLVAYAESLPETAWNRLNRPAKYEVKTEPRQRPDNVKERIVREREFENIRLICEDVAEFAYRPTRCEKFYRLVVVRKNLSQEKGEKVLFDDVRYFFYISNSYGESPEEIVFLANDRCNQENLIEQLKNGAKALNVPVDNLVSNWAYMVMASLAWTLKAWFALSLPEAGRWADKHKAEKQSVLKMEFKRFLNAFMRVPCQIVRQAGRVVYRLLAWNPWQHVFLRGVDAMRRPMRC